MPPRKDNTNKYKRIALIVLCAVFLLCGTMYYYLKDASTAPGFRSVVSDYEAYGMEVHFLDVEQGDCTLLLCGEYAVLIDAGEAQYGRTVTDYLLRHGVEKVDLLVATHRHSDHIGGLVYVLENMSVSQILLNASDENADTDTQSEELFLNAVRANGAPVQIAQNGMTFSFAEMDLTVLSFEQDTSDENERSLVLRADYGETSVLLTGDIGEYTEQHLLERDVDLDCDILKVAHHGSNYSGSDDFLAAVTPSYAVISCGKNNLYGHPGVQALERLNEHRSTVYRTDIMNGIVIICEKQYVYSIDTGKE